MTVHAMPEPTSEPVQGMGSGARQHLATGAPLLCVTDTVAQAGSAALGSNLRQLVASTEALCQDAEDPETIHQLHVALTRFCGMVRLFGLQHRDPRLRAASQQARALAKVVGKARDWEVFCTGALQAVCQVHPGDRALQAFAALARRAQIQAREDCRQTLCAPEARRFLLEAISLSQHLLDESDVRAHPDARAGGDPHLRGPAAPFLQGRLQSLWARLHRRLCHAHSAQSWHLARLATKALRQALELALPVLPQPPAAHTCTEKPGAPAAAARPGPRPGGGAQARPAPCQRIQRPGHGPGVGPGRGLVCQPSAGKACGAGPRAKNSVAAWKTGKQAQNTGSKVGEVIDTDSGDY